ncbi:MAG: undecaprenyldiphospho-muramoylpentapeptide beta-N-acetylglucosaminyltransferase [Mogibacterium sp.]|nr:undecaprenyldiphospho-muramoylpentapeptide beta-N-acetylglucosaminyltransferase [Mogibacterium sp.]
MKVILTGGGTGGHIYPALAIGDRLKEADPSCEILYIGYQKGMETRIVPEYGYPLKTVRAKGVDRSNILKMADTIWSTEYGKAQAYRIMKKFRPDVIVSTGGYVSVPVVLAGRRYGAKIFIHEQNAYPGMANKFLAKYAEKVFLGFREAAEYFRVDPSRLVYSGNPTRRDFAGKDRETARKELGIPEDHFAIAVFGGSLGAAALNEVGCTLMEAYHDRDDVTLIFGTGRNYYEEVQARLETMGLAEHPNLRITPYIQNMADTLAAANVVISRSGALSVAEITMSGRPGIFIPSPNVTGDHQYYNAKSVVDSGGGIIVREDAETPERIRNILTELEADPEVVRSMEEGSRRAAPVNATDIIYEGIMECCSRGN